MIRAVIKRWRLAGFPPLTTNVGPGYFRRKIEKKIEPKEIPSSLIPRLVVVSSWQLEILVTTLGEERKVIYVGEEGGGGEGVRWSSSVQTFFN